MIEQFNQHLLDMSCHELNVFYLNSTELKLEDSYYVKWEKQAMMVFAEINTVLSESRVYNCFIERTKYMIQQNILKQEINKAKAGVLSQYKNISTTPMTTKDAENYFFLHGDLPDDVVEESLMREIIENSNEERIVSQCKALQYIRNNRRQPFFQKFVGLSSSLNELEQQKEYLNELVQEENVKRNIHLEQSKLNKLLYSLTEDMKFPDVRDYYSNSHKSSDFELKTEFTFMCVF